MMQERLRRGLTTLEQPMLELSLLERVLLEFLASSALSPFSTSTRFSGLVDNHVVGTVGSSVVADVSGWPIVSLANSSLGGCRISLLRS